MEASRRLLASLGWPASLGGAEHAPTRGIFLHDDAALLAPSATPPTEMQLRAGALQLLRGTPRTDTELDELLAAETATDTVPLLAVPGLFAHDEEGGAGDREEWLRERCADLTGEERFEEQAVVAGDRILPLRTDVAVRLLEAALRLAAFADTLRFPAEEPEPTSCRAAPPLDTGDAEGGETEGAETLVHEACGELAALLAESVRAEMRADARLLLVSRFVPVPGLAPAPDGIDLVGEAVRLRGGTRDMWVFPECIGPHVILGLEQCGALAPGAARVLADVFGLTRIIPAPVSVDDEALLRELTACDGALSLTTSRILHMRIGAHRLREAVPRSFAAYGDMLRAAPLLPSDIVNRERSRIASLGSVSGSLAEDGGGQ